MVDDRELIGEMGGDRLKGHFVNTSFASGLTDRAAERMIAVLNGDHEQGMGAFTPSSGTLRKGPGAGMTHALARAGDASPPPASSRATLPQPHRPVAAKEASGSHRARRRAFFSGSRTGASGGTGRWAARCATRRTHATRPLAQGVPERRAQHQQRRGRRPSVRRSPDCTAPRARERA